MEKIKEIISKHKEKILFGCLIFLALGLLLFRVRSRAFWMDETAILEYLRFKPFGFLADYFKTPDNHPPLYYFLVIVLYDIFPFGELGIRLLSVLSGIGMAITAYFFAKLVFKEKLYAYLAFIFISLSSYFLLISQMARYHSLAAFLALLSLYFFAKIVLEGYSRRSFALFLLAGVGLCFTDYPHFIYLTVITNAYVFYALIKKSLPLSLKTWFLGQAIWLLSFVPMMWLIYSRIVYGGDGGFDKGNLLGNSPSHWLAAFLMHIYAYFFGENILPWNYLAFFIGVAVLICCASVLFFNLFKGRLEKGTKLIIFLFFAFVFVNVAFLNFADPRYNFIVYPKYVFVAFPLFILLLVGCLKSVKNIRLRNFAIVLILLINIFGLANFYQRKNYLNASYFNDFSGFEFVKANAVQGDYLIINGDLNLGVYEFYKNSYFAGLKPIMAKDLDEFKKNNSGRFWFFTTGSDDMNVNNSTDDKLPKGMKVVKRYDSTPMDPTLKRLKEKFLRRESYNFKNGVFLLTEI